MKTCSLVFKRLLLSAIVIVVTATGPFAAECPEGLKAITAKDPDIPVAILGYRVKPLTKCELEVEAQAWMALLKKKVTELTNAEIAALYKGAEIEKAIAVEKAVKAVKKTKESSQEKATEAIKEVKKAQQEIKKIEKQSTHDAAVKKEIKIAEKKAKEAGKLIPSPDNSAKAKKEIKTALIKHSTDLLAERTAIIDRVHIVLTELSAKGGKTDEYEAYIKAVSGLAVDVTDAGATWTTITGWVKSEEGGVRWAVNFLKFIAIVGFSYFLSIILGKAAHKAFTSSQQVSVLLRKFLVVGTRRGILFIGLFVGLSALEINIGPVIAVIGAAGFVIAFALQNSLSNFASGLLTLIYRPFDLGDMINVAGTLGVVESMNLLSTQLRTPDNQLVVVPNNSVWADVIINVTGITQRRVDLVFGIGYSDDIDKAQAILEKIVKEHEHVLQYPEPVVKLHELADSSVNFVCRPWVKPENYWDVYWDITREVKRQFDAQGVSIPFPQQDVHLYQELTSDRPEN